MSLAGLDMKVASRPLRWASSLIAFLKVKALSAPSKPMPGPKLISYCEGEYSQLWVMTSIPAACRVSSRPSRKGRYWFRVALKICTPPNSGCLVSGSSR